MTAHVRLILPLPEVCDPPPPPIARMLAPGHARSFCTMTAVALGLILILGTARPALAQDGGAQLTLPETEQAQPEAPSDGPSASDESADADPTVTDPDIPEDAQAAAKEALDTEELPRTRAELLALLYDRLASAPDAETGATISAAIERVWVTSESATIDLLMARAAVLQAGSETEGALEILGAITNLAPDFAEGWNRRALMHFSSGDYGAALKDLRQTLALDPNHFQAIAGLATILKEVGESEAALKAYRKALDVHPHFENAITAEKELEREVEGQGI